MAFELRFQHHPDPGGPLEWARIPWDSATFGIEIYEVRFPGLGSPLTTTDAALGAALATWLSARQTNLAHLVLCRLPPGNVPLAEQLGRSGFYFVETVAEIRLRAAELRSSASGGASHRLRPAQAADLPALQAIAQGGFAADRLHLEPHLPADRADWRFVQWLEWGHRDGETIWVYESIDEGQPQGFVHWRVEAADRAYLSLGAVDRKYQGSGLGMLMAYDALVRLREAGFRQIQGHVSLNNLSVLQMFLTLGFSIHSVRNSFHWFRDAEPAGDSKS